MGEVHDAVVEGNWIVAHWAMMKSSIRQPNETNVEAIGMQDMGNLKAEPHDWSLEIDSTMTFWTPQAMKDEFEKPG